MSEQHTPRVGETFFDRLPEHFQNHEILSSFRLAKDGVFVTEGMVEPLLAAYQRWSRELAGGGEGRSIEKIRRRLFPDERPPLWYALDGKRCLAGFLIRGEKPDPKRCRIPLYQANLLSAENELHPRDPFLDNLPHIRPRMTQHEGFLVELEANGRKLEANEPALREIAAAIRTSPRLAQRYPDVRRALRFVLGPLIEILSEAKPLAGHQRMLLPHRFRDRNGIELLRAKGMSLVVENERRLSGCFATKGRALRPFLRREIELLQKAGGTAIPRGFSGESQKKHCVGRAWSQSIAFHLDSQALVQFLKQAERSAKIRKKLPERYSVRDVLERFVSLFQNSRPIDERELIGKLRKREAYARYRRTGSWVFIILDKNVIRSCVTLRSMPATADEDRR